MEQTQGHPNPATFCLQEGLTSLQYPQFPFPNQSPTFSIQAYEGAWPKSSPQQGRKLATLLTSRAKFGHKASSPAHRA